MRGCTRLTRAHDVHNDWIARSMQFADQIRQDPAAPGLKSISPAHRLGCMLKMICTFAHLPLGLVNMLEKIMEKSAKIFMANSHATR